MPDLLWLVIEGGLDIPFQGDASPGCYQWLLSLAGDGDLQCLVGSAIYIDRVRVLPVDASDRGVVLGCNVFVSDCSITHLREEADAGCGHVIVVDDAPILS